MIKSFSDLNCYFFFKIFVSIFGKKNNQLINLFHELKFIKRTSASEGLDKSICSLFNKYSKIYFST